MIFINLIHKLNVLDYNKLFYDFAKQFETMIREKRNQIMVWSRFDKNVFIMCIEDQYLYSKRVKELIKYLGHISIYGQLMWFDDSLSLNQAPFDEHAKYLRTMCSLLSKCLLMCLRMLPVLFLVIIPLLESPPN